MGGMNPGMLGGNMVKNPKPHAHRKPQTKPQVQPTQDGVGTKPFDVKPNGGFRRPGGVQEMGGSAPNVGSSEKPGMPQQEPFGGGLSNILDILKGLGGASGTPGGVSFDPGTNFMSAQPGFDPSTQGMQLGGVGGLPVMDPGGAGKPVAYPQIMGDMMAGGMGGRLGGILEMLKGGGGSPYSPPGDPNTMHPLNPAAGPGGLAKPMPWNMPRDPATGGVPVMPGGGGGFGAPGRPAGQGWSHPGGITAGLGNMRY